MIIGWFVGLCVFSVVCVGIVSGFFLTFSDFLMRSFKGQGSTAGITVMQTVNRDVWRSLIMVLMWGLWPLTTALAVFAFMNKMGPAVVWLAIGAGLYFIGVQVLSYTANVPMNKRLDAMDAASDDAAKYWQDKYLPRWVFWNYIRAFLTGLASTFFLIGCLYLS